MFTAPEYRRQGIAYHTLDLLCLFFAYSSYNIELNRKYELLKLDGFMGVIAGDVDSM